MNPDKTKSKSSECNLSVRIALHKEKIIDDSYTLGNLHSDLKAWVPWDSCKDPAVFQKLNIQNRKEKLMSRRHEKNIELHVILQDSDHPTQSTHSKEVPLGLKNRGTNCYANAALQVLKATVPFSTYLSGDEYGETCALNDGCLSCSLRTFIQDALEKSEPFYPSMILDKLENFGDDFKSIDQLQKDSTKFLRVLLHKFGEEKVKHPKNDTIHHKLFGGMSLQESECKCRRKALESLSYWRYMSCPRVKLALQA